MNGYYDHHALTHLSTHVALYGLITRETRSIAHRAAALCGLNYLDVRRLTEHHAQRSAELIVLEEGEGELFRLEWQALERALRDRPFGLVAIPDATLLRPGALDWLRSRAQLVALDLDLPNLFWRLRSARPVRDEAVYDPLGRRFERIEQLRPFVLARAHLMDAAQHRLVVRGRSVEQLSRELADYLQGVGTPPS